MIHKRCNFSTLSLFVLTLLTACAATPQVGRTVVPTSPASQVSAGKVTPGPTSPGNVNFTLHVLNASATTPINIRVFIDDRLVAEDSFSSEAEIISIPPHKTYTFHLEKGEHKIRAESNAADHSFETKFEITNQHWAILGFEYVVGGEPAPAPKQFEFHIQDSPILFQ